MAKLLSSEMLKNIMLSIIALCQLVLTVFFVYTYLTKEGRLHVQVDDIRYRRDWGDKGFPIRVVDVAALDFPTLEVRVEDLPQIKGNIHVDQ